MKTVLEILVSIKQQQDVPDLLAVPVSPSPVSSFIITERIIRSEVEENKSNP